MKFKRRFASRQAPFFENENLFKKDMKIINFKLVHFSLCEILLLTGSLESL